MILTYWWDLWCWIFKIPSILKCKINLTKKENTHNEVHRSWQWKSNCFQDKINHLKIAHEQSNSQRTNKNVCAAWLGKNCWALERFVILMFLSKFVTLELHASHWPAIDVFSVYILEKSESISAICFYIWHNTNRALSFWSAGGSDVLWSAYVTASSVYYNKTPSNITAKRSDTPAKPGDRQEESDRARLQCSLTFACP